MGGTGFLGPNYKILKIFDILCVASKNDFLKFIIQGGL